MNINSKVVIIFLAGGLIMPPLSGLYTAGCNKVASLTNGVTSRVMQPAPVHQTAMASEQPLSEKKVLKYNEATGQWE